MKNTVQRLLATILVSVILIGCSGAFAVTVEKDTFIVAVDSEGSTFDPFDYADLNDGFLVRQMHEPLAFVDDTSPSGFTPILAKSWEYPDNQTIRLHLNQGVLFQNGETLKASDVLFSVKMYKEKGLLNPQNWDNMDVENTKIIDDYTIEFKTFEPSSFTFSWLLSEMTNIVSEKAYTEAGERYGRNPNGGTGPYILQDWVAGDRVTFTRNDKYWGDLPQFKTLILRFIVEGTARTFAIESGDVDFAYSCPTADLDILSDLENYTAIRQVTSGVNYLWFNNADDYLKDSRVRKALSYALDLSTIIPVAYNNMGQVAFSVFGPSAPQQIRPDIVYTQNMDKAKELMKEAGYEDGFKLKIVITDRASRKTLAEIMKNVWSELNVDLSIEVLELGKILELINSGEYQLTILAEGGFHGEGWRSYFHSDASMNYSKYSNPRVDELFDLAVRTTDEKESAAYYSELQNIMAEDLPLLPLQYDEILNVMRKGFSYAVNPKYNFMAARFYYIRNDE